ncbi:MAG TPA: dockerin type I domain-containing protein [Candidatus Bathyarchaeia archaeon]|nr:dockerin type I domain-containing protein [Candidatus Bathyarchaeia archaeon]
MKKIILILSAAMIVCCFAMPIKAANGWYGVPWRTNSLGNINLESGRQADYRFQAEYTGAVDSLRLYLLIGSSSIKGKDYNCTTIDYPYNGCYSAGDFGILRAELRTDDGSSSHLPSSNVLTSFQIIPKNLTPTTVGNYFGKISFDRPANLVAGQYYHIVFSNPAPDPVNNWSALDVMYNSSPTSPIQPAFPSDEFVVLEKSNSSSSWAINRYYATPVYDLYYQDGKVSGNGYLWIVPSSTKDIQGGNMVRETFTVTGQSRTVTKVGIAMTNSGASSPLSVRLEDASNGNVIEQGSIPASSVPSSFGWANYTFTSPRTLAVGSSYNLVLSAASGGAYKLMPIEGGGYGFKAIFSDGKVQYSTNGGSGWSDLYSPDSDAMFYFTTSSGTPGNTDNTAPVLSNGFPTGELAAGTKQTNITLTTDEAATCKFSGSSGTAYGDMPYTFETTGGTQHSLNMTGLSDGNNYYYYIRCRNSAGIENSSDYVIHYSVAASAPAPVAGDLNSDSAVNLTDFNILKTDFLKITANLINPKTDIDGDGLVTVKDAGILMSSWK